MKNYKKETVEEYTNLLRAFITKLSYSYVDNEDALSELVNDAWVLIVRRNLPKPSCASLTPSTWLYNIAREVIGLQKRRRTSVKRSGYEIEYNDLVCMKDTHGLTGIEQKYYIKQIYRNLNSTYRNTNKRNIKRSDIVNLVDKGYNNNEIATKLNISKTGVEKQRSRIREIFKLID